MRSWEFSHKSDVTLPAPTKVVGACRRVLYNNHTQLLTLYYIAHVMSEVVLQNPIRLRRWDFCWHKTPLIINKNLFLEWRILQSWQKYK